MNQKFITAREAVVGLRDANFPACSAGANLGTAIYGANCPHANIRGMIVDSISITLTDGALDVTSVVLIDSETLVSAAITKLDKDFRAARYAKMDTLRATLSEFARLEAERVNEVMADQVNTGAAK